MHGVSTLHPHVPPRLRPRAHHPSRALSPEPRGDRAQGAAGQRPGAARGRDAQHLQSDPRGPGGHPLVPLRGDGGKPGREAGLPHRSGGPGLRVLLCGERLHHGARHPHGERGRPVRGRRLGQVDHRSLQLRRDQLRALLQRLAPGEHHQAAGRGGGATPGAQRPDRRVRARIACGPRLHPDLHGEAGPSRPELHGVHVRLPQGGEDQARSEHHHRAGHLPRSLQPRPFRLDRRSTPGDPAQLRPRLRGDDSQGG